MQQLPPITDQRAFWNCWNKTYREQRALDPISLRRQEEVLGAVRTLNLSSPRILEVGCGTGWLSTQLTQCGVVTAIDLADESIQRAKQRAPYVDFRAGDVMSMELPAQYFDIVVTLETLSHIVDQKRFLQRLAAVIRPGGYLILTTQNKFVFERRNDVAPLAHGQVRQWVDSKELKALLRPEFTCLRATSFEPAGDKGILRLVNSHKVNAAVELLMTPQAVRKIKEAFGFGQTLMVVARKP